MAVKHSARSGTQVHKARHRRQDEGDPRGTVTEDAFGTPFEARGSMMCVAGETDDDNMSDGEELLVDDMDEIDHVDASDDQPRDDKNMDTTMKGPIYPEGVSRGEALLREFINEVLFPKKRETKITTEVIKKSGKGYALYTRHKKNGKRRKLGQHKTKASAERQERAIHANGG